MAGKLMSDLRKSTVRTSCWLSRCPHAVERMPYHCSNVGSVLVKSTMGTVDICIARLIFIFIHHREEVRIRAIGKPCPH
jgi:hypothetical protein